LPNGSMGPSWSQRWLWLTFAFVPSSLILGVTTYVSTDVAAVPLLWVIPLALYLLSFILVFAKKPIVMPARAARIHCLFTLVLSVAVIVDATRPSWLLIPTHFLNFLLAALFCHGTLARNRPAASHLTEFYFWISLGGMLGGVFNVFIAPLVCARVLEYPAVLVVSCLLLQTRNRNADTSKALIADAGTALVVGLLTLGLVLGGQAVDVAAGPLGTLLMFGMPALMAYRYASRPRRFALCVLGILLASGSYSGMPGKVLHTERNFFGTLRVAQAASGRFRSFLHGTTLHGKQSLSFPNVCKPLGYYSPDGPVGDVFREFAPRHAVADVAVLGLGIGSLACYATHEQRWVFYEINPAVQSVARDSGYFSLLRLSPAKHVEIIVGDARLKLKQSPAGQFGLIVVDAFSSDSIPTHLYTNEALQLYMSKLEDNGLIAFHVTNRFLNLKPVLAGIAALHGWTIRGTSDDALGAQAEEAGRDPSEWVVIARRPADLGSLAQSPTWGDLSRLARRQVWTDDYTNIVGLFRWQ